MPLVGKATWPGCIQIRTLPSRALRAGVPAKAVADHCGTSLLMIRRNYAKFMVEDRARYAALAAPPLRPVTA